MCVEERRLLRRMLGPGDIADVLEFPTTPIKDGHFALSLQRDELVGAVDIDRHVTAITKFDRAAVGCAIRRFGQAA